MTKNDVFRGQKIPQNSKLDPETFSPALLQIPRQTLDLNEILSLVSWIKGCSNYNYIYIYKHKLIMTNYIHGITIKTHWETFLLSPLNEWIKDYQTIKKPVRAKRGKMTTYCTNSVYSENGSTKLLLHELNTDQSQIFTDFYSKWLPGTIRPYKLSSFSLRRDFSRGTFPSLLILDNCLILYFPLTMLTSNGFSWFW